MLCKRVRVLHVQAQLQHEAVDEQGARLEKRTPRTRSRPAILLELVLLQAGATWRNNTHTDEEAVAEAAAAAAVRKAVKGQTYSSTLTSPIDKIAGILLL